MDKSKSLLIIDAVINLILGVLLLLLVPFPEQLPRVLGVPKAANTFYPSILGAVLLGIGIALLVESYRTKPQQLVGLGLGGAVAINLCGRAVLIALSTFGDLNLPIYGTFFLWIIASILVVISSIELIANREKQDQLNLGEFDPPLISPQLPRINLQSTIESQYPGKRFVPSIG